jgi:PPOX class probable F420-dependent enzyme
MRPAEVEAFLARPLVAVLSTASAHGSLHSAPVWFEYEHGRFYVWTGSNSVKAKNLRVNPRASLCIATHEQPYQYVSAEGPCELTTEGLRARCLSICRRYYSETAAGAFVEEDLRTGDSVIVVITPARVLSESSA